MAKTTSSAKVWPADLEAVNNLGHKIVENEADAGVGEDVERGAEEIEAKELGGLHLHAAGKRRGHRVQAGDEFGKDEGGAAAFVEGFGGTQDAGFGVEGEAAEEAEEGPSGVAAEDEEGDVAEHHGDEGSGENGGGVEEMRGSGGTGGDERERGGGGEAGCFREDDQEDDEVAVVSDGREKWGHGLQHR